MKYILNDKPIAKMVVLFCSPRLLFSRISSQCFSFPTFSFLPFDFLVDTDIGPGWPTHDVLPFVQTVKLYKFVQRSCTDCFFRILVGSKLKGFKFIILARTLYSTR